MSAEDDGVFVQQDPEEPYVKRDSGEARVEVVIEGRSYHFCIKEEGIVIDIYGTTKDAEPEKTCWLDYGDIESLAH